MGVYEKPIYRGELSTMGGYCLQFADLRWWEEGGGLTKQDEGGFMKGVDTPMHTMTVNQYATL